MSVYKAFVDGAEVWSQTVDFYQGVVLFPDQYLHRPSSGEITLMFDDETISVLRPLEVDEPIGE
jgi:hypothetical protein